MIKKWALSIDKRQNLVENEALTDRLGNIGVFYMHKGEVTNRGRLGETQDSPELSEAKKYDKRIMGSNNLLKLDTREDVFHAVHEDKRGNTGG